MVTLFARAQAAVIRLRCAAPSCRQAPFFVKLIGRSDSRSGRPKQEVTLVGPGAYSGRPLLAYEVMVVLTGAV
jgi:hypothetical protein